MKLLNKIVLGLAMVFAVVEAGANVNIIPLPTEVKETGSTFVLKDGQTIGYSDKSLKPAALYLQEILSRATGYKVPVKKGAGTFTLKLQKSADKIDESYKLMVTANNVSATACNYRGITNAIATIRQLLPIEIEKQTKVGGVNWVMPTIEISDKPVYNWRGLMLDPVRHFYSVEETKRFLDHMALYKYNIFHWHLIDDQGWRIEIKTYPQLAKNGSYRKFHPTIDVGLLARARNEKNPTLELPQKFLKVENGDTLYGGYYTQKEISEIVSYAAQRGIDVVPELDMPGHNSMAQSAFQWLSCNDKITGVYCLGKDETLDFCKRVYKEVFNLFPFEFVHIGGDEVNRSVWSECELCQRRIKDLHLSGVEELQAWFTREMEKYFNANGKKLLGWEEILDGGVSKTATIYWWRGDHPDITQRSTALGNEVVVCPFSFCYFDYGQDNGTLRHIYDGDIVPTDLNAAQQKLIRGLQGNIWGEWIPTEARMQFMTFPRALALAEKAWTPRNRQLWDNFLPRLDQHLKRLDCMGINYRPLETDIP